MTPTRPLTNRDVDGRPRPEPEAVTVARALAELADAVGLPAEEVRRIAADFDAGRRPSADLVPGIRKPPRPPSPPRDLPVVPEVPRDRRTGIRWPWRRTPPPPKRHAVVLGACFAHEGVPLVLPAGDPDGL